MLKKKTLLFNPGPTNVSDQVREAIKTPDICHREKEFFRLLRAVRKKILRVANAEKTHTAIAFVASATGCNEAVISSLEGKVLVINNGKYSERLKEIVIRYKIPFLELCFNPLKPIDLKKVEKALKVDPALTHILLVHHETTTGMLNDLHAIGKLAAKYKKIVCADTVSSFGGYKIDVKTDNLAFCTVSANKCLESFPGISFVIAQKKELKKLQGKSRSYYFDLYNQWEFEEKKGQTPFTSAVQLFFALNQALDELLTEGIQNRIRRYKNNANLMRQGLKKLGFRFVLPEYLQSSIITSIKLPSNMDYWQVHDELKRKGYTIYSGQSTLDEGIFRIATLGHLSSEDIKNFLIDFTQTLKKIKFKPKYD